MDDNNTQTPLPSIVRSLDEYQPDTIKARARAVLMLAIERTARTLADESNELRLNELSQSVGALGRVAGIADEERDTVVTINVRRDEPPASLREVAPANVISHNNIADIAESASLRSDAHTRLLASGNADDDSA